MKELGVAASGGFARMVEAEVFSMEVGDAKTFKSGREFASFLGLVPRQSGSGGRVRLGSISKRGDPYLRTLLIHGARSVMYHAKAPTAWQTAIQTRRPANVAAVAVAHKMARTAWAILAHGRAYLKDPLPPFEFPSSMPESSRSKPWSRCGVNPRRPRHALL